MELLGWLAIALGIWLGHKTTQNSRYDYGTPSTTDKEDTSTQTALRKHSEVQADRQSVQEIVLEKYVRRKFDRVQEMLNEGRSTMVIDGAEPSYHYTGDNDQEVIDLKSKQYQEYVANIRSNNYKGSIIFHGGCLRCKTTHTKDIGECYTCAYYNWDFKNYKDKSKEQ